jgi:hypothetical protein
MGYLFTALSAAASAGPGTALVFGSPREVSATLQFEWTGSPTDWVVRTEFTIDGVNWATAGDIEVNNTDKTAPQGFVEGVSVPAATQIRWNLVSLTGGTSPTVSVLAAVFEGPP